MAQDEVKTVIGKYLHIATRRIFRGNFDFLCEYWTEHAAESL